MLFNWQVPLRLKAHRATYGRALFLALIAPIGATGTCSTAAAQGAPDLNGIWKLVAHSEGDQEWAILEIKQADGKPTIEIVDGPKNFGKAQIYLAKSPDAEAEAQSAKLKAQIAEEDRPPTVPLVVDPPAVHRDSEGTRVVLVEMFTGAQCGACVAADIAFDALSAGYKPIDLITLQYHVHIPGPDPLTGPDAVSRQAYYGVRHAPSTYFNGRALAGSGGRWLTRGASSINTVTSSINFAKRKRRT